MATSTAWKTAVRCDKPYTNGRRNSDSGGVGYFITGRKAAIQKLLYNGIRYRYLKRRSLPGKIEALSLEITHRCICRCVMCNIWQIFHQVTELSMTHWADLHWVYHTRTLKDYFVYWQTRKRCTCGFNYAFICSTGDVYLCPLLSESAGCVRQAPIRTIWCSTKAKRIRNQVGHAEPCRRCTEPGLERYSLYYKGWTYLKLLLQMGPRRFQQFHMHMGLGNYF